LSKSSLYVHLYNISIVRFQKREHLLIFWPVMTLLYWVCISRLMAHMIVWTLFSPLLSGDTARTLRLPEGSSLQVTRTKLLGHCPITRVSVSLFAGLDLYSIYYKIHLFKIY
jgi:hypothetical protein